MKRILICPLDWGLGHATRSIPVIRALQSQHAEVHIASSGDALTLLKEEFPSLPFYELPAYAPIYPDRDSMVGAMMRQLPRFYRVIRKEHQVVGDLVRQFRFDVVISDNRYGCWSKDVNSILITHQTKLNLPSFRWLSPFVNAMMRKWIGNFDRVWLPDTPGSGLTHLFNSPTVLNLHHIGWLSRFRQNADASPQSGEVKTKYEVTAVVSGPEPQRTYFYKLLHSELKKLNRRSLLVAGEPGKPYHFEDGQLEIVNHLPTDELNHAILSSGSIVCRSGYSSIMDLIVLGKNAIFVPTPEQPEQIILARHLAEKGVAYAEDQDAFSLEAALEKSKSFKGMGFYSADTKLLSKEINVLFN